MRFTDRITEATARKSALTAWKFLRRCADRWAHSALANLLRGFFKRD